MVTRVNDDAEYPPPAPPTSLSNATSAEMKNQLGRTLGVLMMSLGRKNGLM